MIGITSSFYWFLILFTIICCSQDKTGGLVGTWAVKQIKIDNTLSEVDTKNIVKFEAGGKYSQGQIRNGKIIWSHFNGFWELKDSLLTIKVSTIDETVNVSKKVKFLSEKKLILLDKEKIIRGPNLNTEEKVTLIEYEKIYNY